MVYERIRITWFEFFLKERHEGGAYLHDVLLMDGVSLGRGPPVQATPSAKSHCYESAANRNALASKRNQCLPESNRIRRGRRNGHMKAHFE